MTGILRKDDHVSVVHIDPDVAQVRTRSLQQRANEVYAISGSGWQLYPLQQMNLWKCNEAPDGFIFLQLE